MRSRLGYLLLASALPLGSPTVSLAWGPFSTPACDSIASFEGAPVVVPDGSSGAHVIYTRAFPAGPGNTASIVATHYSRSGGVYPPVGSDCGSLLYYSPVPPPSRSAAPNHLQACSDDNGGAFIVWEDGRGGGVVAEYDLYLQHMLSNGVPSLGLEARALCTAGGDQYLGKASIVSDGHGGCYVSWEDQRLGASQSDIYLQHLTPLGDPYPGWPGGGLPVCAAPGSQTTPAICLGDSGSVYVSWADGRSGTLPGDIFACRVQADGSRPPGWVLNGNAVCTEASTQDQPDVSLAGPAGVYIIWRDGRSPTGTAIYAAKLLSTGAYAPGWDPQGVVVCDTTNLQSDPVICGDGVGGFFAGWQDLRSVATSNWDVYVSRLAPSGSVVAGWPSQGRPLSDADSAAATGAQINLRIVPDGFGGILAAWDDRRAGQFHPFTSHVRADASLDSAWPPGGLAASTGSNFEYNVAIGRSEPGTAILAWNDYHSTCGTLPCDSSRVLSQRAAGTSGTMVSAIPSYGNTLDVRVSQNPVTASLRISLAVAEASRVTVEVFDILGRRVSVLADDTRFPPGIHDLEDRNPYRWRMGSGGVYFVRARTATQASTRRFAWLR